LGAQLVLAGLFICWLVLPVLFLSIPCPRRCGPGDPLIGDTRLPGVSRAEARRMLAWGEAEDCRLCGKRRRITILEALRSAPICPD